MVAVFAAVAAFGACIFYALLPLLSEKTTVTFEHAAAHPDLERAKQALIEELRELELDYELGKIEAQAYRAWRSAKESQLAALLGDAA